jgi:hypothetical protein
VIDGEGDDLISRALNRSTGFELGRFDREPPTLTPEGLGQAQKACESRGAPEPKWLRPALELEGPQEAHHPEDMIRVIMRE